MPYLLPRGFVNTKNVILVLAFGNLSYLEACTVLSDDILKARLVCDRLAILNLSHDKSKKVERLAGIHKVAIMNAASFSDDIEEFRTEITRIFEASERKLNFSVSLYCNSLQNDEEYESIVSRVLGAVRGAGFKKANLLRPHSGTELHARDVVSRNALDLIVYRSTQGYSTGFTAFVPDFEEMRTRATTRPVVSSEISLSPRLAKLLINLSSLSKGDVVLDPFCGAGTIIAEAVLQGINSIGTDWNSSRIKNAKRNLAWISKEFGSQGIGSYSLEVGDATDLGNILGDKKVDAVVTEPLLLPRFSSMPSLEKAKNAVRKAGRVYSSSLYSIGDVVKKGGRVVIVVPSVKTYEGREVSITLEGLEEIGLKEFQPRPDTTFTYPVRLAFESTRWVRRMVYVFERV